MGLVYFTFGGAGAHMTSLPGRARRLARSLPFLAIAVLFSGEGVIRGFRPHLRGEKDGQIVETSLIRGSDMRKNGW